MVVAAVVYHCISYHPYRMKWISWAAGGWKCERSRNRNLTSSKLCPRRYIYRGVWSVIKNIRKCLLNRATLVYNVKNVFAFKRKPKILLMNILYLRLINVIHKSLINPDDLTSCNQCIYCNQSVAVDLNWHIFKIS